jgi:hypothetical protein
MDVIERWSTFVLLSLVVGIYGAYAYRADQYRRIDEYCHQTGDVGAWRGFINGDLPAWHRYTYLIDPPSGCMNWDFRPDDRT